MNPVNFLTLLVFGTTFVPSVSGKMKNGSKQQRICAMCHVVVDEIEHEVSKTDPNKLLDIEGFRVDPSGNQKAKKVKYARSETHLTEITEELCSRMNQYAESTNKEGVVRYVLTQSRNGEPIQLDNVSMGAESAERIKHTCNSIIEDHEEGIMEYFKKARKNPKKGFCTDYIELCDDDENEEEEEEEEESEESTKTEL